MINCFAYVILSPTGLFLPGFYGTAFKLAQPLLFGELAIMLYLLIKGANVARIPAGAPVSNPGMQVPQL